ncbi:MAG: PAS domain S-box protein [Candidatus Rokubacteria bacterium]|nr:PAS domain S-box protein [Candidatus Rokubacteria bacterium]
MRRRPGSQAGKPRPEASEQGLRESENRLRALIENASDLITVLTTDGIIRYESPSVHRLLGWRPEELIGQRVFDYVHPDDVEQVAAGIARRLEDPARANPPVAFRVRAGDGSWHFLEAYSRMSTDTAGAVTLVVNSRDVTRQRALEEQRLQAQRMESVGRLAGGVAHDFNNLLTVITGRSHLALSRLAPDDPVRRDIELIAMTAERAARLTQQLLIFSRKQVLRPEVMDLNSMVETMEASLLRPIGEHIELVTTLAPALWAVKADPAQLEQLIMNLALNARDAMPTGGRLIVETANVALGAEMAGAPVDASPGDYVLLRVSDTGVGMDTATRARMFEPFFTTKEMGKGSGLGLSSVYGFVQQSGGHMTVESEPEQGTTIRIYLPRAAAEVTAAEPGLVEPTARGIETVLLVEDEEDVRGVVREILALAGFTVLVAASADEAERICRDHSGPVHLLLTDVVMPRVSGVELVARLRPIRAAMRVLYMSGYADDTVLRHGAFESGARLLPKPFTPDSLIREVREVLDGQ